MVGRNNDLMNVDVMVKELVILFGSRARGEAKEGATWMCSSSETSLDEVIEVTYSLSLKHGIYISPIVMTKDYFEMLKDEGASFLKNVLKEECCRICQSMRSIWRGL